MFWRRRKSRDKDLDREIRSHLELEAEEQQERGLSPEEARYAAKRALGNATLLKERVRQVWGWNWLERSKQDLTYAIRTFARTPGFTAVVILTLALGIGATTAMFSIVNAVLLHPLPYRNPDRLVVIWEKLLRDPKGPPVFDSYRDFQIWKHASHSFERLAPATWATGQQILTGAGPAREVLAQPVGIDFFRLLGIQPALGRTFQPDDLHRGCTVVLQHRFWMTAFDGQTSVVGRHIELNQTACTIIGVMPRGFAFYPDVAPMWKLITPDSALAHDPENANVGVFGLLRPGVSIEHAQEKVQSLYRNEHRKDTGGIARIPFVYPLAEQFDYLTGPSLRLSIIVLFAAVSFVLLIACVNIANLLLGRSLVRQKELAIRAALGSGRGRLIRQLLTEGLLLSFAGAVIGVLLAIAAVHAFRALNPIQMPPGTPVNVNLWVLAFTAALAVLTALLFGLIPALKALRVDVMDALKAGSRTASFGPAARMFGKTLVAAEVMLSLALLAGAGLLIESVNRLASVPLGFRTEHVLTMSLTLPKWSYSTAGQRARFYREVLDRTTMLPGVISAAFASSLPLSRFGANALAVEGRPEPDVKTAARDVDEVSISSDYFRVMDVPLERGRLFKNRDSEKSSAVAIVNQALVREYFPHESPIGKHIQVGEPGTKRLWLRIVGVVADEKDQNYFHQMAWQDIPQVFRPLSQAPTFRAALVLRSPT
ncbi:MAG: ADOP family duplicated permease, partial [Bryobacteraceae bacterium]